MNYSKRSGLAILADNLRNCFTLGCKHNQDVICLNDSIVVRVVIDQYVGPFYVEATTADELHYRVNSEWHRYNRAQGLTVPMGMRFSVFHGYKPIPDRPIWLRELNIKSTDTLYARLPILLGGCEPSRDEVVEYEVHDYVPSPRLIAKRWRHMRNARKAQHLAKIKFEEQSGLSFDKLPEDSVFSSMEEFIEESARLGCEVPEEYQIESDFSHIVFPDIPTHTPREPWSSYAKKISPPTNPFGNAQWAHEIIEIMENCVILNKGLVRALTSPDNFRSLFLEALITHYKLTFKQPFTTTALPNLIKYIKSVFTFEQSGEEDFVEGLETARELLNSWPRMRKSSLWKKVRKVVAYITLAGAGKVDAKKLDLVDQAYSASHAVDHADMTYALLDLILFVVERGFQVYKTGRIDVMFHSGGAYEKWYIEAMDISAKGKYLSNPEAHGIDYHAYVGDVTRLIDQGVSMMRYSVELDKTAHNLIQKTLAGLNAVKASIINRQSAQATRKAPLVLMVEGQTSVAKSTFANILHYYYGSVRCKDVSLGMRFTHNANAKHWDGFSSSQWSILMDDIGYMRPDASPGIDPTLAEFLQVGNNMSFMPSMASLEDKGSTPFKCELVVATTNTPSLNLDSYFACPAAVARRLPYHIRVSASEEYRRANSHMIDETKLPKLLPGQYPNWWNIEIWSPVIIQKSADPAKEFEQTFTLKKTHAFYDMKEFLQWYSKVIVAHNEVQVKVLESEIAFQQTVLCHTCYLPLDMCDCAEPNPVANQFSTPVMQSGLISDLAVGVVAGVAANAVAGYVAKRYLTSAINSALEPPRSYFEACKSRFARVKSRIMEAKAPLPSLEDVEEIFFDAVEHAADVGAKVRVNVAQVTHDTSMYIMRKLGNAVFGTFQISPRLVKLAKLIITVLGAYGLYSVYSSFMSDSFDEQGAVLSKDLGVPPPEVKERESVWYKPDYTVCSFDIGDTSKSWKALSTEDIESKIIRNSVFVKCWLPDISKWRISRAICLGGQYYMGLAHCIPEGNPTCKITSSDQADGVNVNIEYRIDDTDVTRVPEKDLVVFRVRKLPPRRDIRDLFARATMGGYRSNAVYVGRARDGSVTKYPIKGIRQTAYSNDRIKSTYPIWSGCVDTPTAEGDCGLAMISHSPYGPLIMGLHQLGGGMQVAAVSVTYEDVMSLTPKDFITPGDPLLKDLEAQGGEIEVLDTKSPFRFIDNGNAGIYGSFRKFRAHPRTNVNPTVMCGSMIQAGYELKHGAPVMRGYLPWRRAALEIVKPQAQVDIAALKECAKHMVKDWATIDQSWKDELRIYDDMTVVNGMPGVRFVDKINRKTSAGYPYRKSKKFFFNRLPSTDKHTEPIEFNEDIMNRVSIRCERYMEGKRTFPIFSGALKDEALKFSKILINKVRVFYGGSVDFTITMRKFLLSFVRVVQKNKFVFEQAPGTEAQSVEWDFIRHYLTQHGVDRCVFGDFGDFDISMLTEFLLMAFECIALFHEECGCSAEHVRAIRAIGYDIAFCLVDFNGDLIEFFGKNPSGQALTVIINGIVNCLYMRYVYLKSNPRKEVHTFRSNVALITYGDDNGMGVSKLCPWFNHTAIASVLATIGVKYTMADKDAESVPYIHIDQGSFLKRTWRLEPATGTYVCPLEEDSIIKSLMIGVTSREVSPEVQGTEIIHSAMSEWYWYGKQTFDEKRVFLTQLIRDCELVEFMNRPLPTWDQFTNRYMRNSNTFLNDTKIPNFVDEDHLVKIREFALAAVDDVAQIELEAKYPTDPLNAQDLSLTHLDLSGLREFVPVEEAPSSCSKE